MQLFKSNNQLSATINRWQQSTIANKPATAIGGKKWKQSFGIKNNCNSNQQLSNNQPAVTKRRTITAQ